MDEGLMYPVPARLQPYLDDLRQSGLYGSTIEAVITFILSEKLLDKLSDGEVRLRRNGRIRRDL